MKERTAPEHSVVCYRLRSPVDQFFLLYIIKEKRGPNDSDVQLWSCSRITEHCHSSLNKFECVFSCLQIL